MFSLNLFSNSNDSNRCTHLASNNRQCRNLIPSTSDDHVCRFHSDQAKAAQLAAQQEAEEARLVADLYGQISDLDSPRAVAKVLSNLFRLIAENRIHPKQASSLNSTARIILRALKDHEIATRHAANAAEEDLAEAEAEERQGRAQALTQVVTAIAQGHDPNSQLADPEHADVAPHSSAASFETSNSTSNAEPDLAPVAAGFTPPGFAEAETSQTPLTEITSHEGAAPFASKGAGVDVDLKPASPRPKSNPPTDQPCNTYKEALIATLRHSNMTQEQIDEYVKQHCDRLPYEPNSAKPKKPFIKFRPRRFRWSNSW